MDDWHEKELARSQELADTYRHLIDLVTQRFTDIEDTQLGKLAKAMARCHVIGDNVSEICFHQPTSSFPIHVIDGKHYPSISFAVTGFVPLWALYLTKAREALELVESIKEKDAA